MNQNRSQVIAQGRAYVRLIEAADVLLAGEMEEAEDTLLHQVRQIFTGKLRELVATLPPEITAEILAASEKIKGPTKGFSPN